ncbi:MAG: phosphate propanoyltransferase [Candidatus Pacebacteria bacterium]|nr:phosphate propanoyltransferase [Candidatus Paceibacterota bacterium]
MNKKVNIEVSARHIHLKKEDFENLFGEGTELTVLKKLSQPGMFAANEIVGIKNEHFEVEKVRIVGPLRSYTQIEISETEAIKFKINPPLRRSGDIKNSPGMTIVGLKGQIEIKDGVIISKRHVHMTPDEADEIKVKDGDLLKVKTQGERGLIFENVVARVDETYAWGMHIDTDEGNASGISGCEKGEVIIN